MITRILIQVIESMSILHHSAGALCQSQEFIQLSIHKTFWNVVSYESIFELVPSKHMISRKHSMVMIPPQACRTMKLLCSKMGFARFRTWYCQQRNLGLDCANPSVRIEGFLHVVEQWRLNPQEFLKACFLRRMSTVPTPLLVALGDLSQ